MSLSTIKWTFVVGVLASGVIVYIAWDTSPVLAPILGLHHLLLTLHNARQDAVREMLDVLAELQGIPMSAEALDRTRHRTG